MQIFKIAHAGFNLGDVPRKLTDVVFGKIKEISLKATGNSNKPQQRTKWWMQICLVGLKFQ